MSKIKPFGTEAREEFKDLCFEEIMNVCAEKGQMDWLEEAMNRRVEHYKYQRVTIVGDDGKKRKVIDKTLPKVMEYRKPTFIELKEMFLVELCGVAPAKKRIKPMTMEDKLALKLAEIQKAKEEAEAK